MTNLYAWPEPAERPRRLPAENRRELARAEGRQLPTYAEAKEDKGMAGPCAVWACTNETARPDGRPRPCRSCRLAFGSFLTPVANRPNTC